MSLSLVFFVCAVYTNSMWMVAVIDGLYSNQLCVCEFRGETKSFRRHILLRFFRLVICLHRVLWKRTYYIWIKSFVSVFSYCVWLLSNIFESRNREKYCAHTSQSFDLGCHQHRLKKLKSPVTWYQSQYPVYVQESERFKFPFVWGFSAIIRFCCVKKEKEKRKKKHNLISIVLFLRWSL